MDDFLSTENSGLLKDYYPETGSELSVALKKKLKALAEGKRQVPGPDDEPKD